MIEKNIVDRVPTKPGQIKLTPVSGAPDLFIMERADEPTVEGTPIDKATLDSIIQSRLTGRYYDLVATKTTLSSSGGATNPIPTSWSDATATGATSGGYSITASGSSGSYHPHRAFDGNTNTYWSSNTSKEPWIQLNVPEGITVNKMKIAMRQPDSWSTTITLQGQTNSGTWVNLSNFSLPNSANLLEYTLSSPSTYKAYRLNFSINTDAVIELYEWQISDWNTATYRYDYKIEKGAPVVWTRSQRVTVQVPSISSVGVTSNSLNGVTVNTILQPNRKYELIYTGVMFSAKEV